MPSDMNAETSTIILPGIRVRRDLLRFNLNKDVPDSIVEGLFGRLSFTIDVFVRLTIALLFSVASCSRIDNTLQVEYLHDDGKSIVPPSTSLERLFGGSGLLEGPVWNDLGYVLLSDMAHHVILRWSSEQQLSTHLAQTGWNDALPRGPNGLAFDAEGLLTICQHGKRTVVRVETDGTLSVLVDKYEGRRLNSPNDLVFASSGKLYFTDPPFGLQGGHDSPERELPFSGIYSWFDGELMLMDNSLSGPNGIALSPDESYAYVSNSDSQSPIIKRYRLDAEGRFVDGSIFSDFSQLGVADSLDGLKTDTSGNVYVASSKGILVLSPSGKHVATIRLPEVPYNMAWGDEDRSSLFIAAQTSLYRLDMSTYGN